MSKLEVLEETVEVDVPVEFYYIESESAVYIVPTDTYNQLVDRGAEITERMLRQFCVLAVDKTDKTVLFSRYF